MSDNNVLQNAPDNTAFYQEIITKHSIGIIDVYFISYLPPSWSLIYTEEFKSTSINFMLPFSAQWQRLSLYYPHHKKKHQWKLMAKQKYC